MVKICPFRSHIPNSVKLRILHPIMCGHLKFPNSGSWTFDKLSHVCPWCLLSNCAKLGMPYNVCCSIVSSCVCHIPTVDQLCQAVYHIYCLLFNCEKLYTPFTFCCWIVPSSVSHILSVVQLYEAVYLIYCLLLICAKLCIPYTYWSSNFVCLPP